MNPVAIGGLVTIDIFLMILIIVATYVLYALICTYLVINRKKLGYKKHCLV